MNDINKGVRIRGGNPCNYKLSLQDIFHVNSPSNIIDAFWLCSTESDNQSLGQQGYWKKFLIVFHSGASEVK